MKRLTGLFVFLLAAVISCTSVKPTREVAPLIATRGARASAASPTDEKSWDEGVALFRQGRPETEAAASSEENYLEICDPACVITGLIEDEEKLARASGKIARVVGLNGTLPPEAISYLEAANDFSNRYNRAMLARFHSAQKSLRP